ncbi:carbohydrate ABC transporter permease [Ruminococcus albus]|uniref:Putative aldouronate transport system permease protein n=1 Tax=Ruminococcus albus TaxID=1264 RepID=A0A1I1KQ03_RUMAL|nr:carbohydrate ABC transporter permease [Ruminococcus albus]SFC60758.1 putative aldouronate transport system permease protein [Ruminococcus albus]
MAELTKKIVSTPNAPITQAEKPKRDAKDIGSKTKHSIVSRRTKGDNIFDAFNTVFMLVFSIVILYPLLNMVAVSFNDGLDALKGGITLVPRVFTLKNYQHVLSQQNMLTAAKVSVLRTVIGTLSATLVTSLLAYILSRKEFLFKKQLSLLYVVTMYVSGGLIPIFLVYKALGMTNSFMVYILPGMVPAFSMLVLRTYMNGLPDSLAESAMMDGAGHLTIFIRIIFPLCMPVVATVALFTAVGQWNSWFDAMLYNRMNSDLTTLQYELMQILNSITSSKQQTAETMKNASATVTPTSVRAAATVVTALPIVILYPFLQRYFVAGLTIGGVKE